MFRFVRQRGVSTPTFITVYASGTINRGSVVEFSRTSKMVIPASANSTYTNIFGIALDYAQGASDSQIRVVPFVQGQLWEADCANATNTTHLMIKHTLSNSLTLANTSVDQSVATGIFVAYNIPGTTTITKLYGEFIRSPVGWDHTGASNTPGFF